MSDLTTITANFNSNAGSYYSVTVNVIGSGSVLWNYGSLSGTLYNTGTINVPNGNTVTLTASASAGNVFTYWSFPSSPNLSDPSVQFTAAGTVTANFISTIGTYAVSVNIVGDGKVAWSYDSGAQSGEITASSIVYVPIGKTLTLTATGVSPYVFTYWLHNSAMNSDVTVDLYAADTITANFQIPTAGDHEVTINVSGSGKVTWQYDSVSGTVSSSGIVYVPNGKTLTLTATAVSPNVFVIWTDGAAQSAISTYVISSVTGDRTITAEFGDNTSGNDYHQVDVNITGFGTVTAQYDSVTAVFTSSGSFNVPTGKNVTFTASPSPNSRFVSWSGAVTGSATTVSATIGTDSTVNAEFDAIAYTITASADANGSITPSGAVTVTEGGSQTFTFSANSGYKISKVLIDGVEDAQAASSGTYTFSNVSGDHTIEVFTEENQSSGGDDDENARLQVFILIIITAIMMLLIILIVYRLNEAE